MPLVQPTNQSVCSLTGLHLYHSGISNCAMRVRIALEEKGLEWTSHHFDLRKKEHLTAEYFGINPKGLVPSLVHDGVVVTESGDIIDYIDTHFPDPKLRPAEPTQVEEMYSWIDRATSMHVKAVKTHIYEKRMAKSMAQSDEQRARYEELQSDPELLEFHAKSTSGSFSQAELDSAKSTLDAAFSDLEARLDAHDWIAGDRFSLADIAWMPLYFTLGELAGYSFDRMPNVQAWADRIEQRPSYEKAVRNWWPL